MKLFRTDASILRVSTSGLGNVYAEERNHDSADSRNDGDDHVRHIARLESPFERE
jgi:hypothetical protein